jgi:hypothetical protein
MEGEVTEQTTQSLKAIEKSKEQEALNSERINVASKVKSGEDKEGVLLFAAQKELLTSTSTKESAIYRKAEESKNKISEVGEANKLSQSLKELYQRQALENIRYKFLQTRSYPMTKRTG